MVYIREAHALDSRSPILGKGMPVLEEPETFTEREDAAAVCMAKLALEPMPALIDGMDNAVEAAYESHPDRLYLIGKDGRVSFKGGEGPFGFKPDELEQAIRTELGLRDV